MSIRFVPLEAEKQNLANLKQLYRQAFSLLERIPFWFLAYKARHDDRMKLYSLYDEDVWIGMICFVQWQDTALGLYLAIKSSHQSLPGYGSKVLASLQETSANKRLVLTIQSTRHRAKNLEKRLKRKRFYERNGFIDAGLTVYELGRPFELLSYQGSIKPEEVMAMYEALWGRICRLFIKIKSNEML